jgi:hypothetical protein
MAKLTVDAATLSGVAAVTYSASGQQIASLTGLLQAAVVPQARYVLINPATGTYLTTALNLIFAPSLVQVLGLGIPSSYNGSPQFAVAVCRRGGVFVDYGLWPFGQFPGLPARESPVTPSVGFTGFVDAANVVTTVPPVPYVFHTTNPNQAAEVLRGFQTADPYAWALNLWSFGNSLETTYHYPYRFGLVTTRGPSRDLRPIGPAVHLAVTDTHSRLTYDVYVYSGVGIRVGRGWYFNAVTNLDPATYAHGIVQVLGGSIPVAVAGTPSCTVPVKPSLRLGDTGPWVAFAQARLNAWGAHVPLTGTFDAATQQGVLAVQRAHAGQQVGHAPAVLPSGQIGPGLWALLCSTPPRASTPSGSRPPRGGRTPAPTAPPGLVQWLMTHLHLTQAEAELVLVGGGVTALVLLSGK